MNLLFIHQNFPGQYLHLAQHLQRLGGYKIVGLGEIENIKRRQIINGITTIGYPQPAGAGQNTHHYLRNTEAEIRRGQAIVRSLFSFKKQGFKPDVICAHPGWGEALFIRDVFPDTPILMFAEFFFRAGQADLAFCPEYSTNIDMAFSVRIRNTSQILSLMTANHCISPTHWQASSYPKCIQDRTTVLHDGIDTQFMQPDSDASLTLYPLEQPGDSCCESQVKAMGEKITTPHPPITLTGKQKVITYVARNLEPYRGFDCFLKALPSIQERHPDAHCIIVGGTETSYSPALPDNQSYKDKFLKELGSSLDFSRIHFVGKVPYRDLKSMFCISSAHIYLTYPFVLSWSMMEAMACEVPLIASRTAPVEEVVTHGENGILIDFYDTDSLANAVDEVLTNPKKFEPMRKAARTLIQKQYNLQTSLQKQQELIAALADGKFPQPY